jgi:chromate transporter
MIYLELLFTFFKIGLFSFGGGYAVLALIQQEVVSNNKWLSLKEFVDVVAISQATPGPIAINSATYVGYKTAGIGGATVATLGVTLPSLIIVLIMARFFLKFKDNKYVSDALKGLRPAVVGLIAAAAIVVAITSYTDYKSIIIFVPAFIAAYKFKADPILVMVAAGLAGYFLY